MPSMLMSRTWRFCGVVEILVGLGRMAGEDCQELHDSS